jgi:DNA-nicking Smr family endonuclease
MAKKPSTRRIAADDVAADARDFRAAVQDVKPLAQAPQPAGLAKPKPHARLRKNSASTTEHLDETMPLIGARDVVAVARDVVAVARDVVAGARDVVAADGRPSLPPVGAQDAVTADGALSFHRGGVRAQVMRRLRRGLYPIEDELDLHGQNQAAARNQLADFIARSREGGCRCVRIVHGKGYRSGARGPVLKTAVNLWLRRHMDVMAFVSARALDGGTGAVYVLLRS